MIVCQPPRSKSLTCGFPICFALFRICVGVMRWGDEIPIYNCMESSLMYCTHTDVPHIHLHTHTHIHMHVHTHSLEYMLARTHAHTHMHTHAHTHTHSHTYTHTHACTCKHITGHVHLDTRMWGVMCNHYQLKASLDRSAASKLM